MTDLTSSGAISGILAPTSGFLVGVFLGASLPAVAPTRVDFTILGTEFTTLAGIQLGQQFFIGNGFNSANLQQVFFVPDGATRLFFGIADGSGFMGNPDFYADNVGSYRVDYRLSNTVPEPSTIALSAFGLALLALSRRRRTA